MESCGSDSDTAYSRPVRTLVETSWRVASGKGRSGFARRRFFRHRFLLLLFANLCAGLAPCTAAGPIPLARKVTPVAQASPPPGGSPQSASLESKNQEKTRTEQYTLSHERQAKAVAYSQAGYAL